jgi:hypothetical protein
MIIILDFRDKILIIQGRKRKKQIIQSDSDEEELKIQPPTKAKKQKFHKTEDDSIPLPDPFPLPKHYPTSIETALKRGNMAYKEKQAFLSEVASAILRFKRYPTHDDYVCVARSVTNKYPFLKSTCGKPYVMK